MTDAWLAAVRRDLPATNRGAYLNAGSTGPLPVAAAEAMRARITTALEEGRTGLQAWEAVRHARAATRERLAAFLGTSPERIALTTSTTSGINLALNGLDLARGDELVSTDGEHPGVDEPLLTQERRRGVLVRRAPVLGAGDPLDAVASLIGPRTRAVVLSHVLFGTGRVLPIAAIAREARARGAVTIVDGAQSAGAISVRVDDLGADAYAVPGQKWLCGPTGTGALYVRAGFEDTLEVSQGCYMTRDREAEGQPIWAGARRFDVDQLSTVALLGLEASLAWRSGIGLEESLRRAQSAADALRARLAEEPGVTLHPGSGPHATLVSFALDGVDDREAAERLDAQGVLVRFVPLPVSSRPASAGGAFAGRRSAIRVSVGFWTSEDDLERLLSGLRRLVPAGATAAPRP